MNNELVCGKVMFSVQSCPSVGGPHMIGPVLFKLVHLGPGLVGKRAVGLRLKGLLVYRWCGPAFYAWFLRAI